MDSMIIGDHEHPPKDSFEEVDPKQIGRSYECIFCKRGFTTAQALGGHMNIHRKDRAKIKRNNFSSNSNNSSTLVEDHSCYPRPRFYQPIFTNYPQTYISELPNYQECYTTSTSSSTSLPRNYENNQDFGVITSPSREEKMMSLSLQFGWSVGEDKDSKRRIRDENQDDELDLELRLGQ
ncbi:uncharacterized protein [Rutidosis leptorrhynchoides]|uniref:uncharacterized protein n=1 Tax=Rutidosis leptorrhynchoides TaxID=125765 RepID=UPI003A99CF5C